MALEELQLVGDERLVWLPVVDVEVIHPGDRVFFEPGEDHWHGAAPTRFMTHLAMLDVDDEGNSATWGPHVSDEEYRAAPALGKEDS